MIEPGEPWGAEQECPPQLVVAADDAELAGLVDRFAGGLDGSVAVAVAGGDLHRTLGSPPVPRPGDTARRLPLDLLRCELDGEVRTAVAQVVLRRPGRRGWWRGPITAMCNVQFHGTWDVAPRGHPNDGRADLVEVAATMPFRQRLLARRRLATGTHVPHPDITSRRVTEVERDLRAPPHGGLEVHLDRRRVPGVGHLRITVVPDGFALYVGTR